MDDIFADMGALGVANDPSLTQGNPEELAPQIEGAIQIAAGESRQIPLPDGNPGGVQLRRHQGPWPAICVPSRDANT